MQEIEKGICPRCGAEDCFEEILTPESVHYSKTICRMCERWIQWNKNPSKAEYRSETTKCAVIYDFCKICGRTQEKLGWKETLTAHHVIPLEEDGEDIIENIIVLCSACHKLVHWVRLYVHKHLNKFYDKEVVQE